MPGHFCQFDGLGKVLLEEEEYQTVLKAFRDFPSFSRNEVELLNRIENAPITAVRPAKR